MDDILVIVLTLIIAVVGALSQIKKKKQGQVKKSSPEQEPGNFWNLFQEDQEYPVEQEEEIFEPKETEQAMKIEPEIVETPGPKYEFTDENEGTSVYGTDLTKKQNLEKHMMKQRLKGFSLKKAVIYSEILNRKYN